METRHFKVRRVIRLDGQRMEDRAGTHRYLKAKFYFPDHYGNNLDALFDLLTEIGEPQKIILYNIDALKRSQPEYGRQLLKVLRAAEQANGMLEVIFYDGFHVVQQEYRIRFEPEEVEVLDDAGDFEPLVEWQE